jgi:hypothetical protein
LSRLQIQALIGLAREAFSQEFPPTDDSFDTWRHRQTMLAVERPGFTSCHNEDYLPLKRWFLELAGRLDEAQAAGERAEIEPRTWAIHKLHEACSEVADIMPYAWQYAMGILKNRGMDAENADPKAVWKALYTVKRRAAQLRRTA